MKLSQHTAEAILEWASKNPTVEVTGIVASREDHERVLPMLNISSTPETDYVWDPDDMRAVYNRMDQFGEKPYAFYHSHPNGKSDPSEDDMRSAMYVGIFYLIAYPAPAPSAEWHLSAWECIEPGVLVGVPLDIR